MAVLQYNQYSKKKEYKRSTELLSFMPTECGERILNSFPDEKRGAFYHKHKAMMASRYLPSGPGRWAEKNSG